MLNKKQENPLGTEKISKLIKKFAIPCIISLVVSSLYNIVDQIFIGRGVGYLGNAATNIVFPFTVITMAFSLMIGDGASAYLSLSLGKKDKESAKKGVANGIIVSAILGILFLIIEKIKGSPINQKVEGVIHSIGFVLLMILMIVVTFNDIIKLF